MTFLYKFARDTSLQELILQFLTFQAIICHFLQLIFLFYLFFDFIYKEKSFCNRFAELQFFLVICPL